eukprot:2565325-Alexandrium_andersonii.AAC.1
MWPTRGSRAVGALGYAHVVAWGLRLASQRACSDLLRTDLLSGAEGAAHPCLRSMQRVLCRGVE